MAFREIRGDAYAARMEPGPSLPAEPVPAQAAIPRQVSGPLPASDTVGRLTDDTADESGEQPFVIPNIPLIRSRAAGEQRATFFELFFDLVYVFAVTQLSHYLLADLSWPGAARATFMLVAIYWAWNYTTWMANWFDPRTVAVRLVLVFVMMASLLMAIAVPDAFGERGLLFAASYVALQVVRNVFVVAVCPTSAFRRNFGQILAWSLLTAPPWIVGAFVDGDARWGLWGAALLVDLTAPLVLYWLPGLGSTPTSQWQVDGSHFAERFQLFVIIALGESIVLAGATASESRLTVRVTVALGVAFLLSTALWWLYFGQVSEVVAGRIGHSAPTEAGKLGRDVYTYLHLPIIAGIVLAAVGLELVIAHPEEPIGLSGALVAFGGPALFLAGLATCCARVGRRHAWWPVGVAGALLAAAPLLTSLDRLAAMGILTAVLITSAAVEQSRDDSSAPARDADA
ncbi:low temperature requirement A [Pseudofrankia inefficax]|uniref:Low temperature requirement A n=2 Tax=Pseudofrankia inefficax (strain DSM 45817 / CECT 9037 / DDB 130130 / EuI1c) TaxID=298654 RepID=E3JDF7_PSEI1|nr:low temperature requirement A [Pseudofrankia inefficax]